MNAAKKRPVVIDPAREKAIARLRDACDQLARVDWEKPDDHAEIAGIIGRLQVLVPAALANLETGEQFAMPEQASRRAEPEGT